uniref:CSON009298 protein n=1 Tax=Culicoides sonorensis TaxID=179676 RepID=A0A336M3R2_CULSO
MIWTLKSQDFTLNHYKRESSVIKEKSTSLEHKQFEKFTMDLITGLLLIIGVMFCSCQNIQTPCPEFFQYKYDQQERQYVGILELPPPELGQNIRVPLPGVS